MAFDQNNQYTGKLYGQDRIGHITPDLEFSEYIRPFLPVSYPAPYLPGLRQDQGHPKLANVVLSSQHLVGVDKSGAIVPAGLFCGTQATVANGGQYCILVYGINDVQFAMNAETGTYVQSAGEHAVLAVPSDATPGNVTLPDGTIVNVTAADITFAKACNLFDANIVKPIAVCTRLVYQYIGGVTVKSTVGGMLYTLNGVVPTHFIVHNYMHEMGTAVQTQYIIRLPWVGATRTTLTQLAQQDGIVGYSQGYGLTFAHFTGTPVRGEGVVGSSAPQDAGNYTNYVPGQHTASQLIGRVIGVMNMIDRIGFANRVRTLWDTDRFVGPVKDPNASSMAMGGTATGGIDNTLFLHTDGIFKKALTQNKLQRPEYGTYVIVRVNL